MRTQNLLLLLGVLALVIAPLWWFRSAADDAELFTGADGQAEAAIVATRPDYEPWFAPVWEPPSGEIESLLFGLQAALGAAAIAYCLGYYRGRAQASRSDAAPR